MQHLSDQTEDITMTDEKSPEAAQAASVFAVDAPPLNEFDRRKARAIAADQKRQELLAKGIPYLTASEIAAYETRDEAVPETRE
ncbi:hypothetical protein GbCGDNIH4_7171 [Granulibacter bethesdensis CGDNIH4]|nr:hypothetical protein GbCGDNIH4_7171 [Granulibacter bethesdensis CGDNIH4]